LRIAVTIESVEDTEFLADTADVLAALPGVLAVALGGSRAQGTHRPDSDWDLAIYYRNGFDPQTLRAVGWAGEVSAIGGWGGGVFNGGAWLEIDNRRVDVHYRDLGVIENEMEEAEHGRFRIEPLLFHLAGIPSYLVVGELAVNRVLRGSLPSPAYPIALRQHAPRIWWGNATRVFDYARANYARRAHTAQCVGLIAQAATQAAHAILAARGEWVTNEKALLTRAGLGSVNDIVAKPITSPDDLTQAVVQARRLCDATLRSASNGHLPVDDSTLKESAEISPGPVTIRESDPRHSTSGSYEE
jgi:predicted nucleotidyltransferase